MISNACTRIGALIDASEIDSVSWRKMVEMVPPNAIRYQANN